jgi:dolichol-phosphate mannosyltransferase
VLPTYNEAGNIVKLVHAIMGQVPPGCKYEIIVVDDNSPDGTYELAQQAFRDVPSVVLMLRTTDRGFARSIRAGIERARGERILVMDTDFTHDPAEIPRLLHVAQIYDIVSGSRFCPGGNMQDLRHYIASMLYNWILRVVLRTQVQDNLGGYFTMRRAQLLRLPMDEIFVGYGEYFFRLLYHAQRRGMSIVEIPAIYRSRTAGVSKSRFAKLLITYTAAAIRVRRQARRRASNA